MRILVLGAGGTGGYFGGRLAASGADVSFLLRPVRAGRIRHDGLQIRSPLGDVLCRPQVLVATELAAVAARQPFDLILLSCKAYDLDSAMDAIAPAVGPATRILPILNGLRHYPLLDARFGAERVQGGLCFINATLNAQGEIVHLDPVARLSFGERDERPAGAGLQALSGMCTTAGIEHRLSPRIELDAWAKYAFLCSVAASTCLLRGSIGRILATEGGAAFLGGIYAECTAVAAAEGEVLPEPVRAAALAILLREGSSQTSSMYRDLVAGKDVEALQIVGDMVHRAVRAGLSVMRLDAAWIHLQSYMAQRQAG
ncbi:2-dehydropantoate 2-reductase [Frateuria aurantia]|uniref:2-dehydropantoate 2-reductase n=1 Tax=Frateuria aurantia (strain ATCC 33424 / DSM 6220 / KCTC 2777 / LMG 1558 / NBRC 3245 / NCIMB 13370) TaxID=767434 RepID=H8L014_FRAAD|nr:2-dehydropantoate 2-reductase [Frateuria aurantia]AFC85295.1 2-dehydropantoate 2-reductase [Frateuria aurantia DSM 6220]